MEPEVEVTEICMPADAVKDICEENVIECYSLNNEDSTNGRGVSEVRIGNSVEAGVEDLIVKTPKVCHGFKIFDSNSDDFYMNYPFGVHAHAEGTSFADFVPIDGALFPEIVWKIIFRHRCQIDF